MLSEDQAHLCPPATLHSCKINQRKQDFVEATQSQKQWESNFLCDKTYFILCERI